MSHYSAEQVRQEAEKALADGATTSGEMLLEFASSLTPKEERKGIERRNDRRKNTPMRRTMYHTDRRHIPGTVADREKK